MKVLVLGATGATGRLIVKEAKFHGHAVVALVRNRAAARDLGNATLVEGDAQQEGALVRALDGCSAVISSLGTPISTFRKVTLLSTATSMLVGAMMAQHIRRFVCITGVGAGDSRGHGGFLYDNLMRPFLLRSVYEDKNRQEDIVRASPLDWVLVRPGILNDKPATGNVQAHTDLSNVHGGAIARADVAKFVVEQVTSDRWLRQTPLILSP